MSVQNLEITTENLLSVVVNLSKNEFDRFFSDARKLKKREETLTAKIRKFDLSADEQKIYQKLQGKFRAENITNDEQKTLTELSNKLEELNVQRMKCLVEISKIRKKDLSQVMKELNIAPKNYE